jgi:hypothetical protein
VARCARTISASARSGDEDEDEEDDEGDGSGKRPSTLVSQYLPSARRLEICQYASRELARAAAVLSASRYLAPSA